MSSIRFKKNATQLCHLLHLWEVGIKDEKRCHIQKVTILYPSREFGTRSIGIHVPKCIEKWETQQEKLPKVGIYTTGRMP